MVQTLLLFSPMQAHFSDSEALIKAVLDRFGQIDITY